MGQVAPGPVLHLQSSCWTYPVSDQGSALGGLRGLRKG